MEAKGLLYALSGYVISLVLIVTFWYWWFDKPLEWRYFISIISSLASIVVASGIASGYGKKMSFIVVAIIAAFWILFVVVDIVGLLQDIYSVLNNKRTDTGTMDIIMYVVDEIVSSKAFAIVSGLMAFNEYKEYSDLLKKNNV